MGVITITPQETLKRVAQNLGLKTLPKMQGTTRAIYDTVALPANAGGQVTFFDGVGSRPFPRSNVNSNRFEVNSALAVQAIAFYLVEDNLADPPLLQAFTPDRIGTGVFDFIIGNQSVLKKTPISSNYAAKTGVTNGAALNKILLEAPIVIPPQVRFKVDLRLAPAAAAAVNNIACVLYGTGVLLNLKNSL